MPVCFPCLAAGMDVVEGCAMGWLLAEQGWFPVIMFYVTSQHCFTLHVIFCGIRRVLLPQVSVNRRRLV